MPVNSDSKVAYANTEGLNSTYSACALGVAVTATGAIFGLQGSATKLIRVRRVICSGSLTTGAQITFTISKTTADVSSASGAVTITPALLAGYNAAATAVTKSYTSATLGTGNTTIAIGRAFYAAPTAASSPVELTFGTRNTQALVIRGTAEFMQVSCTVGSYTGAAFDTYVEFTEE